jgi:hypothetical protein
VVLAPVAGVKSAEAKSARPGADKPSSADDGDKTNSSPGRARNTPLKPLRGECRVISGVTVVTTVCLLPLHTGCGRTGRPAFPAPSEFRERDVPSKTRVDARRDREAVSGIDVIARSGSDEAIQLPIRGDDGLLRGACHRARRRRDPVARNDSSTTVVGCLTIEAVKIKSVVCAKRASTSRRVAANTNFILRGRVAASRRMGHNAFLFQIHPSRRHAAHGSSG